MAGGFQLVNSQGSYDFIQKVQTYYVTDAHATLLAQGDCVTISGTGQSSTGISTVDASSAGGKITGIIAGFHINYSNLDQTWLPASTAGYVYVLNDPNALYEVEIADTALAVTDIGQNVDIVATAATLSGGMATSNMKIDGSTVGSGADVQFRIVSLVVPTDGTTIGAVGNKAIVRLNEATEAPNSTGV